MEKPDTTTAPAPFRAHRLHTTMISPKRKHTAIMTPATHKVASRGVALVIQP